MAGGDIPAVAPVRFSRIGGRAEPSGIRAAQVARNDMIAFSKGHPDPAMFRVPALRGALDDVLADPESLQYSAGAGLDDLREAICALMARRGVTCAPQNVLVTNGSQQGLSLATMALADPGDTVIAREPLYTGALQVFDAFGLKRGDGQGGDRQGGAALHYEIPNFHNPTGRCLDLAERRALVAGARESDAILIEDDPYGDIRFTGAPLPGLLALDTADRPVDDARTLYLGSLSKTVAPGLRIGWVVGPAEIVARLANLKYITDIQCGTLVQALAARVLSEGFEDALARARDGYRARRDALVAALEAEFGGRGRWDVPEGGFFLWLQLAGGVDAGRLLARATEEGVNFVPGRAFGAAERFGSCLRLSFSHVPAERMAEGVRRMARAYDALG